MYRVWVALAALLGFVLGYVVSYLIGVEATGSAECDGPCFSKWDEVSYVSYAIGALAALAFGVVARKFAKAS